MSPPSVDSHETPAMARTRFLWLVAGIISGVGPPVSTWRINTLRKGLTEMVPNLIALQVL